MRDPATIAVTVPHDRYHVAVQVDTCQMWVLDSTGRDAPHGPFPSSRQAWLEANDLNTVAGRNDQGGSDDRR